MTSDRPLTRGGQRRLAALPPRRELVVVLLLGAVGAGLVFLAMRQSWAQVRTAVPAPLPTSVVTDSGQSLVPYADALDIAALASLAAVLATRHLARRATGVLLAGLGIAIVAAVSAGVTASGALAAATGSAGPAAGSGAGTTAGSTTEGSSQAASTVPDVAGFHSRAVLTAATWQAMAVVGALAIIAAGVLVIWRAEILPVMSSRYDSPTGGGAARPAPARAAGAGAMAAGPGSTGPGDSGADGVVPAGTGPGGTGSGGAGPGGTGSGGTDSDAADQDRADSASMWESLSRGEDPTSAGRVS
jgi:uncharacterized membrane protein (TIGR02234 family)